MDDDMKCCSKCGERKPRSEFYRLKRATDGLNYWCKGCALKANRAYREANPGYYRKYMQEYRIVNPEYDREYYQAKKARQIMARLEGYFKGTNALD